MRLLATLCTMLAVASAASKPFVVKGRVNNHVNKALGLRGGDVLGLPITQENLAAVFIGWYGLNALVSVPAPEKSAEMYNQKISPGDVNYWIMESMGNTVASIAIMAYLATFKDMDATDVVVYSALPCVYLAFKNLLNGTYDKIGIAAGTPMTAFMVGCTLLVLTGRGDASLIAKIFSAPPVICGLIGYFSPDASAGLYGMTLGKSDTTQTFYKWLSFNLFTWGTMAMTLLFDGDWKQAIGYAGVLLALGMADSFFVSKNVEKMNLPKIPMYFVFALGAFVGAGMLVEGGAAPAPVSA